MSILEKAEQFFDLKKKKQQKKIEKLKKIIGQLEVKARELKKRMANESEEKELESMVKEYKAVKKFIGKSRRRLVQLKAIRKAS